MSGDTPSSGIALSRYGVSFNEGKLFSIVPSDADSSSELAGDDWEPRLDSRSVLKESNSNSSSVCCSVTDSFDSAEPSVACNASASARSSASLV